MKKFAAIVMVLLFVCVAAPAPAWFIKNHILTIEKGDNLWNISRSLYGNGYDYRRIWAGRLDGTLKNPAIIYPNNRFRIDITPTLPLQPADSIIITKKDTCCTTAATYIINNPEHNTEEKDKKEGCNWCEILNQFCTVVLFPFLAMLLGRLFVKKKTDNRSFFIKLVLIILGGIAIIFLVRNIHWNVNYSYNYDSRQNTEHNANNTSYSGLILPVIIFIIGIAAVIVLSKLLNRLLGKQDNPVTTQENTLSLAHKESNAYQKAATLFLELKELTKNLTGTTPGKIFSDRSLFDRINIFLSIKDDPVQLVKNKIKELEEWMYTEGFILLRPLKREPLMQWLRDIQLGINAKDDRQNIIFEKIHSEIDEQLAAVAEEFRQY